MDFAIKMVIFVLLVVPVFGRIMPLVNNGGNNTEDNDFIPESCNGTLIEENNESDSSQGTVCPTPQCADESCHIETPLGHLCPTCICEGSREKNSFESTENQEFETKNETKNREILSVAVMCNGSADDPSRQKECKPANFRNQEERTRAVKMKPGSEVMEQNLENYNPESLSNEEPESTDSSLNAIQNEPDDSPKKIPRRKRSANTETVITNSPVNQQRWTVLQQDQLIQNVQHFRESDELERETSDENSEDYGGMQIFKGESETDENTSNEITAVFDEESVIWEKTVPGCPTPLCENSSCRIGIPRGHRCPTCICQWSRQP